MSSIYAIRTPTGFGILTDRAVCDVETGILASVEPKIWYRSGTRFAAAMHGHPWRENVHAMEALVQSPGLDDAQAILSDELERMKYALQEGPVCFGVLLAGYSERADAWRMLYASFNDVSDRPWSLVDVGNEWSRGAALTVEQMRPIFAGITQLDEFALLDRGAGFFEAQRRTKMESPGFLPAYLIGGGVDLTIIDNAGVRQERLRDWPDVIGQPISP